MAASSATPSVIRWNYSMNIKHSHSYREWGCVFSMLKSVFCTVILTQNTNFNQEIHPPWLWCLINHFSLEVCISCNVIGVKCDLGRQHFAVLYMRSNQHFLHHHQCIWRIIHRFVGVVFIVVSRSGERVSYRIHSYRCACSNRRAPLVLCCCDVFLECWDREQ